MLSPPCAPRLARPLTHDSPRARPRAQAGQQDPDIFFTDRPRSSGLGQRNKEYISFWADEEPVLAGRTPIQVSSWQEARPA
jgi:hypothetical protein